MADDAGSGLLEQAYAWDAGDGAERDLAKAVALYREAAAAGEAAAHLRLGYLHETGEGVEQDYGRARGHYEQAVALGLPEARMRLAMCHLEGWGGPVDREAFLQEMSAAAEAGYVPAIRALAGAYFIGVGTDKDEEAGRAWLAKLAAADDPEAQANLGRSLERSARRELTLEADRELARTWYQLSAEQDFALAMRSMAQSLMKEQPDAAHWTAAKAWLEMAAEGGDPESPFVLGVLTSMPKGVTRGETGEALRWIELAAERSNGRAVEVLDRIDQGMSLPAAVRYVLNTPYSERYIQRYEERNAAVEPGGDHSPLPVRMVKPVFPRALRMSETEGQAMVAFTVDTTGRVQDVRCVEASHPLFGERAVAAVSLWRFKPAVQQGRRVNTRMQVPVLFQFEEADRLSGLDGLIEGVRHDAIARGWVAEDPPPVFQIARPLLGLPRPGVPEGQVEPTTWRVLLLLGIDEKGVPNQVHVVRAEPEWMGAAAAEAAKKAVFMPVMEERKPIAGWVVLPWQKRPPVASP